MGRRLIIAAMLLAVPIGAYATGTEQASPAAAQVARYHGVLIRVPDLARARSFYVETLGFSEERVSDNLIRLVDDSPIYLEQAIGPLRPPDVDEARSAIAFKVRDIQATARRLREAGVEFLSEEPFQVAVGLAMRIRDPFGNIHSLLQPTLGSVPAFTEPAVYNSGLKNADADTAPLRSLFAGLGMVVLTERYFPPSLPIGHGDRSFAFMLHENEPGEPEIRARGEPGTAAVSLVFSTEDLQAASRVVGNGEAVPFALGRRLRATIPSGLPIEIWQMSAVPRR